MDPAPQLDNMGDLSDADQVLASDQVRTALQEEVSFNHEMLADRTTPEAWPDPSILVSPIQAGETGVSYHMTVPRRYQDLDMIRGDFHLYAKFGAVAISMREAFLRQIASAKLKKNKSSPFRVMRPSVSTTHGSSQTATTEPDASTQS